MASEQETGAGCYRATPDGAVWYLPDSTKAHRAMAGENVLATVPDRRVRLTRTIGELTARGPRVARQGLSLESHLSRTLTSCAGANYTSSWPRTPGPMFEPDFILIGS